MRLIDADELILVLNDYACIEAPKENEDSGERRISEMVYRVIQNCIGYVENHPTAYDVDKVVEKLEKQSKPLGIGFIPDERYIKEKKAIEIVKQCGVADDVCEWKGKEKEFIQNPHTKRLYSNESSMKNVYCNTCGKKIKVVE